MPARTDHDRRDAQHAARLALAEQFGRYIRRATEEAYAYIELHQEVTEHDGSEPVDWSAVGRAAAHRALATFGVIAAPERAVDGYAVEALEAGGAADGT